MRKLMLALFIAVIFLWTTPAESAMLGYWNFDEGSGTVANDLTGNGNTGSLQNMDNSNWVSGKFGDALSLDGVNEWVSFATQPSINNLSGAFTVETWVKGNASDMYDYALLFDKSHGFTDYTGWVLQFRPGNGVLEFGLGQGDHWDSILSPNILDNNWHFVSGTYDGTNLRLYIDGVLIGTQAASTNATNNRPIEMGRARAGYGPRYFKGSIDESAIFDEALSLETIRSQYQNGINPVPEPSSLLLLSTGLLGLLRLRRRK